MDLIANYESDTKSDQDEVKTPRKLKAYTTKFKIKIIKHAKDFSSNAASKRFGVDRSSVVGDSSPAGKFKKRLQRDIQVIHSYNFCDCAKKNEAEEEIKQNMMADKELVAVRSSRINKIASIRRSTNGVKDCESKISPRYLLDIEGICYQCKTKYFYLAENPELRSQTDQFKGFRRIKKVDELQIIKVQQIKFSECKRVGFKQFHDSNIKLLRHIV
uniref:Uncharacterized protein n=1 Tax=Ditylenchus dipsaci TaxID=166011 RepID=A0A915ELV5_9BILA